MTGTLYLGCAIVDHPTRSLAPERAALAERREAAHKSVRLAHGAGVLICAGTDFGGGSLRANQLAWEVQTLVAAGLEPYDALAAATVNGGRLLGEPAPASSLRAARPTSYSSTAIRSPTRGHCGGCGAPAGDTSRQRRSDHHHEPPVSLFVAGLGLAGRVGVGPLLGRDS